VPGLDDTRTFVPLRIAVLTVSDTRTEADDTSGRTLVERIENAGHEVAGRMIVTDDVDAIVGVLRGFIADPGVDVVISTGGTGITGRDVTPEAMAEVREKEIPGFGELFRWLSFQDIGSSTIQSRATAGIVNGTLVFALPGSPNACRLAMDSILLPQLDNRTRPCSFVGLLDRI